MSKQADRLMAEIVDDAEILHDQKTATTRFVVWRKIGTRQVSVAMVQNGEVVSVNAGNILFLAAKVLPQYL